MPIWTTPDGRYVFAMQTPGEGDGNSVVYDKTLPEGQQAVWDRFSHEAARGASPFVPPSPSAPLPAVPQPVAGGGVRVIRVTDERDGEILNRGYSYWSQAWVRGDAIWVFVGHADGHPRFFRISIASGVVVRNALPVPYTGTAEGWYWDADGWVYLCDGPCLRRVNPFTGEDRVVLSIEATHPSCRIFQAHSSDDGSTHSATVQRIVEDGPYPNIGTVVSYHGEQTYFPANGTLDESAITPDGAFLIIKENDDNRVITIGTRETRLLTDADGAVGHSDCGPGIMVGEDNIHGACVLWDLTKPLTPGNRRELFKTWGMGHVSVKGGRCLLSDASHLSLVALDGSGVTPLTEHGMVGTDYDHQVMANLDPSGRVAAYVSNADGRMDVYLLVL